MDSELVIKYLHGNCQKFAIVIAELLGLKITVTLDEEAYDENFNIIPLPCLVHAYLKIDEQILDAAGYSVTELTDFEINFENTLELDIESFKGLCKSQGWPLPTDKERAEILTIFNKINF